MSPIDRRKTPEEIVEHFTGGVRVTPRTPPADEILAEPPEAAPADETPQNHPVTEAAAPPAANTSSDDPPAET